METVRHFWDRIPSWGKWIASALGVLLLLGIGIAIGASNEDDLKSQVATLESEVDDAHREVSRAEEDEAVAVQEAEKVRAERGAIISKARTQARGIVTGAKQEAAELADVSAEIEAAEGELANVEDSLTGAEHAKELSHFGEGIMRAEVDYTPGATYESAGGEGCYWALLNSANTSDISSNEITINAAQQIVTVSTPYFTSSNCGTWKQIAE